MPPKVDPTVAVKAQAPTASDPGSGSATVVASGEGLITVFASVTITANKAIATAKAVTPTATVEVTAVSDPDASSTATEQATGSADVEDNFDAEADVHNHDYFGIPVAPQKLPAGEKK